MRQNPDILRVVDFTRLHTLADETGLGVRGISELFLDQMTEQLGDLRAAILAQSVHAVTQVAHRCAGSSMLAGMERLSKLLYDLEHSPDDKLVDAEACARMVEEEFGAVMDELEAAIEGSAESGAA